MFLTEAESPADLAVLVTVANKQRYQYRDGQKSDLSVLITRKSSYACSFSESLRHTKPFSTSQNGQKADSSVLNTSSSSLSRYLSHSKPFSTLRNGQTAALDVPYTNRRIR